jgi:hypothetical protein
VKKFITITIIVFFGISASRAEKSVYGNENRFLFSSPQFSALGEAKNALCADPIPANNPASVILSEKTSFFAGYTGFYENSLWAATTYAAMKIDSQSVISAFVGYLNIPNIDSVEQIIPFEGAEPTYKISQVSSSELSGNINYARKLFNFERWNLSVGGSINIMRRRLVKWTGYGIGADLGILFSTNRGNNISLQIDNITTQYTHWSKDYHENILPQAFLSYGFSKEVNENLKIQLLYRSPDLFGNSGVVSNTLGKENVFEDEIKSGSIRQNPQNLFVAAGYGADFTVKKIVSFRMGLTDSHKLTFGGGFYLFQRANIDFAYIYSSALDGTYSVSLKFSL